MENNIWGSIPCLMVGGPLDGKIYGDLPDPGKRVKGALVRVPLEAADDTAAHALYICRKPVANGGIWKFEFVKVEYPGFPVGTGVKFAEVEG